MMKKYLGIIGFILGCLGVLISVVLEYFYGVSLNPLGEISFFVWITTMAISTETNRKSPRKWLAYTMTIISLVSIGLMLFIYS
jgi:hypothetical protein